MNGDRPACQSNCLHFARAKGNALGESSAISRVVYEANIGEHIL